MSYAFAALPFAILVAIYLLWWAPRRLPVRLKARSPGSDPFWVSVKERLAAASRQQRCPVPELLVLPEYSPNALVWRMPGGRAHVAVTEGFARILGAAEMDAALALCLVQVNQRSRPMQTLLALALLPFAEALRHYPALAQWLASPVLSAFLRTASSPKSVFAADRAATRFASAWELSAGLQKLSVTARKLPLREWNLALDSLFLLSPLVIDNGPQWVFPTQPSVADRCERLLRDSCERELSLS